MLAYINVGLKALTAVNVGVSVLADVTRQTADHMREIGGLDGEQLKGGENTHLHVCLYSK